MSKRHVVITGGSTGIGLDVAKALCEDGCVVHLTARRTEPLAAAKARLNGEVYTYPGDVSDESDREALAEQVAANCGGKLDGLVLNAALYDTGTMLGTDAKTLRRFFEVNTFANLDLVQRFHPLLQAGVGKSIVFVSSTLAIRPVPGTGIYASSKAALNAIADNLALELASEKIRVNTVLPGVVNTPIHDAKGDEEPSREEKMTQFGPLHPLGRVGEPGEVAATIQFLLSDQTAWVTGATWPVDGGISLA